MRALLQSEKEDGCYHCLTMHNLEGNLISTVEPMPFLFAGQGCEQEFVPFSAIVSIHAACLACELIMDWINGKTKSTLRTKVLNSNLSARNS